MINYKFVKNRTHKLLKFIKDLVPIRTYEFGGINDSSDNESDNIIIEEFNKDQIQGQQCRYDDDKDDNVLYKCKFLWSAREIYENEIYINTGLIDAKNWFISQLPKLNSIINAATEDQAIKLGYYDTYLMAISKLKNQTTVINFEDGFTIELYYINFSD